MDDKGEGEVSSGSKSGGPGRNNGRVGRVDLPSTVRRSSEIGLRILGSNNGSSGAYGLGICGVVGVPLGPPVGGSRKNINFHSFNTVVRVTFQRGPP